MHVNTTTFKLLILACVFNVHADTIFVLQYGTTILFTDTSRNESNSLTWPRVISDTQVDRKVCHSYAIVETVEEEAMSVQATVGRIVCFPNATTHAVAMCGALNFFAEQSSQQLLAVHGRGYHAAYSVLYKIQMPKMGKWDIVPHQEMWALSRKQHRAWLENGTTLDAQRTSRSLGVHFRLGDFESGKKWANWTRTFGAIEDVINTENITHVAVATNANSTQRTDILSRLSEIGKELQAIIVTEQSHALAKELRNSEKVSGIDVFILDQTFMALTDVFLADTSGHSSFSKLILQWRDYLGNHGPVILL